MKTAEQWHDEGVTNLASTLHRVDVKEIRAIQIDALREAREMIQKSVPRTNPALSELDRLIRDLELK